MEYASTIEPGFHKGHCDLRHWLCLLCDSHAFTLRAFSPRSFIHASPW